MQNDRVSWLVRLYNISIIEVTMHMNANQKFYLWGRTGRCHLELVVKSVRKRGKLVHNDRVSGPTDDLLTTSLQPFMGEITLKVTGGIFEEDTLPLLRDTHLGSRASDNWWFGGFGISLHDEETPLVEYRLARTST